MHTAHDAELLRGEWQIGACAKCQRQAPRCGWLGGRWDKALSDQHRRQRVPKARRGRTALLLGVRLGLAPAPPSGLPNRGAIGCRRKLVHQPQDKRPVRVVAATRVKRVENSGPAASSSGRRGHRNPARSLETVQLVTNGVDVEAQRGGQRVGVNRSFGKSKGAQDRPARWVSEKRVIGVGRGGDVGVGLHTCILHGLHRIFQVPSRAGSNSRSQNPPNTRSRHVQARHD